MATGQCPVVDDGIEITGWAAPEAKAPLEPYTFRSGPLRPYDCDVQVINCGICHSDLHLNNGDWGSRSQWPQVSGHELVGRVTRVGTSAVVKVGDYVAVGWQNGSCHECRYCFRGDENLCAGNPDSGESKTATAASGNKGGFADKWRGDSRFAFKLPQKLCQPDTLKYAGPLMCGGITVWSPLVRWAKPSERVGVLGIGGLGHMAVKFARARGNYVTAFSRNDKKKADTIKMGPTPGEDDPNITYVNSSDPEQMAAAADTLDVLIVTINVNLDWKPYISCMARNGRVVFVGVIPGLKVPISISKQVFFGGSAIGGRKDIRSMLSFCADHPSTWPQVEVLPMSQINDAIERVATSAVRFRMVVENPAPSAK